VLSCCSRRRRSEGDSASAARGVNTQNQRLGLWVLLLEAARQIEKLPSRCLSFSPPTPDLPLFFSAADNSSSPERGRPAVISRGQTLAIPFLSPLILLFDQGDVPILIPSRSGLIDGVSRRFRSGLPIGSLHI
jgi:hypothetical protein